MASSAYSGPLYERLVRFVGSPKRIDTMLDGLFKDCPSSIVDAWTRHVGSFFEDVSDERPGALSGPKVYALRMALRDVLFRGYFDEATNRLNATFKAGTPCE